MNIRHWGETGKPAQSAASHEPDQVPSSIARSAVRLRHPAARLSQKTDFELKKPFLGAASAPTAVAQPVVRWLAEGRSE